jgi:hypothetical protein
MILAYSQQESKESKARNHEELDFANPSDLGSRSVPRTIRKKPSSGNLDFSLVRTKVDNPAMPTWTFDLQNYGIIKGGGLPFIKTPVGLCNVLHYCRNQA